MHGNVGNLLLGTKTEPTAVLHVVQTGCEDSGTAVFFASKCPVIIRIPHGMCYACVCHTPEDETGTKSVKVCDEGPIFKIGEVII